MIRKRPNTRRADMVSRKYNIGQRVFGIRSPYNFTGILVETYCTLNNGFRNPAYVVLCEVDGKTRSFQCLVADDLSECKPGYQKRSRN
jgi:hypothetical protein